MRRALIIAEAGVNHNGNLNLAYKMVDAAKNAGADIIKFQTGKPEEVISKFAPKADYQEKATGKNESQLEMCKKVSLDYEDFIRLKVYCEKVGICFLSTPFDLKSIEFLENLNIGFWKIPSGEVTNLPYLIKIANTHRPIVMSTGMCNLEEIGTAIKILDKHGGGKISLLHCTTEYPVPYEDVNLKAMHTLREQFGLEVGYSDHTQGIEVSIAAVAMGASIIEKHFTLDRNMEGPDHKASLQPDELEKMVRGIRHIENAIGTGDKRPARSEIKNIEIARKSIVAACDIRAGEIFSEQNLTTKRPGNGISPMQWYKILGRKAKMDYIADELIAVNELKNFKE